MKRAILVFGLMFLAGCASTIVKLTPEQIAEAQAREQQYIAEFKAKQKAEREVLANRFKEAYGDQWQQKLLEYDLAEKIRVQAEIKEQERVARTRPVFILPPTPQYRPMPWGSPYDNPRWRKSPYEQQRDAQEEMEGMQQQQRNHKLDNFLNDRGY